MSLRHLHRVFLFMALALLFAPRAMAQDPDHRLEIGATVVSVNALDHQGFFVGNQLPSTQWLHGMFFRYQLQRWGLRAYSGYSEKFSEDIPDQYTADGQYNSRQLKEFRLGFGGQFQLAPQSELFYAFLDLGYARRLTKRETLGGFYPLNLLETDRANGLEGNLGLGLNIPILKIVHISPELSANALMQKHQTESLDRNTSLSSSQSSTTLGLRPVLRLQLSVQF